MPPDVPTRHARWPWHGPEGLREDRQTARAGRRDEQSSHFHLLRRRHPQLDPKWLGHRDCRTAGLAPRPEREIARGSGGPSPIPVSEPTVLKSCREDIATPDTGTPGRATRSGLAPRELAVATRAARERTEQADAANLAPAAGRTCRSRPSSPPSEEDRAPHFGG